MEKAGVPVANIITTPFLLDAQSHAKYMGMPGLRHVATPAPQVHGLKPEKIREQAQLIIDKLIDALTVPLTEEEKHQKMEAEKDKRIVCKGTLEEVNRYFLLHHWSDANPIIPPTEEAVKWMLGGTDRSPDEVVALIPPRDGGATVEVIAINAVMAGCRPEYMPVLIAAVEALTEEQFDLYGAQSTTNSVSPLVIVNGPIRDDININCDLGLLGYGWQANNAIGRALRLILITVGGSWSKINAMCTLGKLPIWVIGEYEEVSHWDPLHVELGYERDSSTVTVIHASAFHTIAAGTYPSEKLLTDIGHVMGEPGPLSRAYWWAIDLTLVLNPLHARIFAEDGYSKEDVKRALLEKASIPFSRFKSSHYYTKRITTACPWFAEATDDTMIPLLDSTEQLTIVVAGGGNWGHAIYFPAWGSYRSRVTKKIKLPPNWDELIEKAKEELQY